MSRLNRVPGDPVLPLEALLLVVVPPIAIVEELVVDLREKNGK